MTNAARFIVALATLASIGACDDNASSPSFSPAPAPASPPETSSRWTPLGPSEFAVGLDAPDAVRRVELAMAEARRTLDDARRRWDHDRITRADAPITWLLKWRTPVGENEFESLWIAPERWNEFRVEGRLVSTPVRTDVLERRANDLVNVPAEEIVDWLRIEETTTGVQREGAFTERVLREIYGDPVQPGSWPGS